MSNKIILLSANAYVRNLICRVQYIRAIILYCGVDIQYILYIRIMRRTRAEVQRGVPGSPRRKQCLLRENSHRRARRSGHAVAQSCDARHVRAHAAPREPRRVARRPPAIRGRVLVAQSAVGARLAEHAFKISPLCIEDTSVLRCFSPQMSHEHISRTVTEGGVQGAHLSKQCCRGTSCVGDTRRARRARWARRRPRRRAAASRTTSSRQR